MYKGSSMSLQLRQEGSLRGKKKKKKKKKIRMEKLKIFYMPQSKGKAMQ